MKRQALSEKQEKTIVIALIVMGAVLLLSLISYACFRFEAGIEETSFHSGIPALDIFNFLLDHIYLIFALLFLTFGVVSLAKNRPIPGTRVVYGIALFLFAMMTMQVAMFFQARFYYGEGPVFLSPQPPFWKGLVFFPILFFANYFFLLFGLWSGGKRVAFAASIGIAFNTFLDLYAVLFRLTNSGNTPYTVLRYTVSIIDIILGGLCMILWVSFLGEGKKLRYKLLGIAAGYFNAASLFWLIGTIVIPFQKMLLPDGSKIIISYSGLVMPILTAAADVFLIYRSRRKKKAAEETEEAEEDYSILGKEE